MSAWTPAEDALLKKGCEDETLSYSGMLPDFPGRTAMALMQRVRKLGWTNRVSTLLCRPAAKETWTLETLQRMRDLAPTHSLRATADLLGVDRNALTRRAKIAGVKFAAVARPAAPRKPVVHTRPPPPTLVHTPVPVGGLTMMELTPFTCRYPVGDPRQDPEGLQRFCGCRIAFDLRPSRAPYCAAHGALVVAPSQMGQRLREAA